MVNLVLVLDDESQAPIGPVIDVHCLSGCYSATGTLNPYFKVTRRKHELVRTPPVGCDLETPTFTDSDNLERLEQRFQHRLTIGAHGSSVHFPVNHALLTALLQTFEIREIL
jgi:hypothetical protein